MNKMVDKKIIIKSLIVLALIIIVAEAAGPTLDPALKTRIDFNYQFGLSQMPMPDEDEPDTADFLIPNHKTMFRLRHRFTEKDVCVLRYEMREYNLRENSYRRFIKPINYEFDHRIKLGMGYASSPKAFPYFFYEYLRSLENLESHSGIFGARINFNLATMFEPTYTFSLVNNNLFHIIILRCQQIITPRTYLMLKNSFLFPNFADPEAEITWTNQFEPFLAHRIGEKTALHIGYRQFNNFAGTVSYNIWAQFIQQITKKNIIWTRVRTYLRPAKTSDEQSYRSMSFEFRIAQKSLSSKGRLKNCTLNLYNIFFKNNIQVWANVTGIELNYVMPK